MNLIKIDYDKLIEIIRYAYTTGTDDVEEGDPYFGVEGTTYKAEIIIEELVDDNVIYLKRGFIQQ